MSKHQSIEKLDFTSISRHADKGTKGLPVTIWFSRV